MPVLEANGDGGYVVRLRYMENYPVRSYFAKYGADAYFDTARRPERIERGGQIYRPGDALWPAAKYAFRCSLFVHVGALQHLCGLHFTTSNMAARAQFCLGPDHPIRRLLKPFTFGAVSINYEATIGLSNPNAILYRATSLMREAVQKALDDTLNSLSYEQGGFACVGHELRRRAASGLRTPWDEDLADYWEVLLAFVRDYLALYWPDSAALAADNGARTFWDALREAAHYYHVPPRATSDTEASEQLHEMLAHLIATVTGMHTHMGGLAEYTRNPECAVAKWMDGEECARPQWAAQTRSLIAFVGQPMVSILSAWDCVFLDEKARDAARKFRAALEAMGERIDARNAARPIPFRSFHPQCMDTSIAV